jgi:hypothetical protein
MDPSKATWHKSSYSGSNGGQCVEVASDLPGVILVRDSKDPAGLYLTFTTGEWLTFTSIIKSSEPDCA